MIVGSELLPVPEECSSNKSPCHDLTAFLLSRSLSLSPEVITCTAGPVGIATEEVEMQYITVLEIE